MTAKLSATLGTIKSHPLSRPLLPHLPWCAALLLIVLVLFGKYLVSSTLVVSQYGTDIFNQYLHTHTFASAELNQGNLPTWNPYTYGGHPFLADFQSAVLYPITWILSLLFNPVTALNWWVAIHVFLFGFLAYVWAVQRNLKPAAAFIAATTAMLGGTFYMHVYAGHISNLGSMAWTPLVFIGIDGWLRRKHAGWLVAGATGVALQIYAGHPQYVYYTAIVAALYSLAHLPWREWRARDFRVAALGLLALYPLAAILGAAQLIPGYNALSEAVRSTGASLSFASMFGFNPENILTLFAPWIYGQGTGAGGEVLYWGRCYLWEMQLFFGICMLMLAVHGFAGLTRPNRWRLGILLAAIAILALGKWVPPYLTVSDPQGSTQVGLLYWLFYKVIPFYSTFRGTSKFIYLLGLFAALLAGLGAHRLLTETVRPFKLAIACLATATLLLLAGIVIRAGGPGDTWHAAFNLISSSKGDIYYNAQALPPEFKTLARALTGTTLITNSLWLLAFGGLLLAIHHAEQYRRHLIYAAGALALLNLGLFAWTATTGFPAAQAIAFPHARISKSVNPQQPLIPDFIRQKQAERPNDPRRDFRTINTLFPSANMSWRQENIWGYDPSVLKRYAEYMYFSQGLHPDHASQNPPFNLQTPPFRLIKTHMLDLFRCRFALAPSPDGIQPAETGEPLPGFLIISNYKILKNRDAILTEVGGPGFKPSQMVVLESEPIPAPEKEIMQYSVRLREKTSDSCTVEVTCDRSTILVMTDAYAKGWKATSLPGSVQTNYNVMPANYAMRAIPIAAGRHVFKIEYIQPGLAAGVQLSLVATLLLAIIIYFPAFRRRLDLSK